MVPVTIKRLEPDFGFTWLSLTFALLVSYSPLRSNLNL